MALCPLAIASTADLTNGTGSYYFALNGSGGGQGPIIDQSFVATGTGTPPNGGFFQARNQDLTGSGTDAFVMTDISGVVRWAIGMNGIEGGANSGDNFAVFSYADNGGFLSAPLTINRASGGVQMQNGLTVGNTLITTGALVADSAVIGENTTVGGGVVQVNGPSGLSRVYDPVYNIPPPTPTAPGAEVLLATFDTTGVNNGSFPYTAAKSGLYCLTVSTSVSAPGLSWTNGTTAFVAYASLAGGLGTPSDSYLVVDSIATPAMTVVPIGEPNYYLKDQIAIINLNAGETITMVVQTQGGMNLGTSGGITVYVQPLIA